MVTGDGSTSGRENRSDSGLGVLGPLPSAESSAQGKRLVTSETVVNPERQSQLAGDLPQSPSAEIFQRLFPPLQDSESTRSTFDPAGIELDHFRIEERIGMGGMGAVFRAVDERLDRQVALKLLAPSQAYDRSAVKRFQNEARAAARLDHENIARVFYIGEEQHLNFIAFEFVTGSNIRDLIHRSGKLSPSDTVNYVLQIACALKHTSAMGVVHRDIKPSNIIVTPNGRAKLVDLGLARKDGTESQGDLTLPGTTLGTFDYISPEQAKDPRSVDVRSDIYSLGCTMYHMLTGRPPYPEGTVLQKLLSHQGNEAPDPAAINRTVPDNLSAVVRRMMNSDRNRRHQTPEQLIRDLTYVASKLGLRGVNPEGLVWVASNAVQPRRWTRHVGWVATIGILLAIVGTLTAFPSLGRRIAENDLDISPGTFEAVANSDAAQPTDDAKIGRSDTTGSVQDPASPDTKSDPGAVSSQDDAVSDRNPDRISPVEITEPPDRSAVASTTRIPEANPGNAESGDSGNTGTDSTAETNATPPADTTQVAESNRTPVVPIPPATTEPVVAELPRIAVFLENRQLDREYPTLEAACAAAQDGSVIELRFNGRHVERSFKIVRKNITIRAAKGFSPIVELEPSDVDTSDSVVRMLTLHSGPVHIVNVEFLLSVPESATAERYALFGLTRPEQLQLDQVNVTIENGSARPAAVVDITPIAGRMPVDMPKPVSAARKKTTVEFQNCMIRGEADLVSLSPTGDIAISVENSAVSLKHNLLHVREVEMTVTSSPEISLSIEDVSTLLGGSLLRMSGPVSIDTPRFSIHAADSIFSSAVDVPLVHIEAEVPSEEAQRMLEWSGVGNFFDRIEIFWTMEESDEVLGFDEWRQHWGSQRTVSPWNGELSWAERPRIPDQDFDHAKGTSAAFVLDAGTEAPNPAIQGSADGSDAGCDLSLLRNTFALPVPPPERPVRSIEPAPSGVSTAPTES